MNEIVLSSFTLLELKEAIKQAVRDELQTMQEKQGPEYLTRNQVAAKLNITLPTLHSWTKQNILKAHRIGSRVLFLASEVREIFNDRTNGIK